MDVKDITTKTMFQTAANQLKEAYSYIKYRIEKENDPVNKRCFENAFRELDYALYHFERANEYIEDVTTGRRKYHGQK